MWLMKSASIGMVVDPANPLRLPRPASIIPPLLAPSRTGTLKTNITGYLIVPVAHITSTGNTWKRDENFATKFVDHAIIRV